MLVLWEDVPPAMRVTREELLACVGYILDGDRWLKRHLEGGGCAAAAIFGKTKYSPCGRDTWHGSTLCWQHHKIRAKEAR